MNRYRVVVGEEESRFVDAESIGIVDGVLVFFDEQRGILAFAPYMWDEVEFVEKLDLE